MFLGSSRGNGYPRGPPFVYTFGQENEGHCGARGKLLTIWGPVEGLGGFGAYLGLYVQP